MISGLPAVLGHHVQPHPSPGQTSKAFQPPLSLKELHMLFFFPLTSLCLLLIFLHSPKFYSHFVSCRSLTSLTKNCAELLLQLQSDTSALVFRNNCSPASCSGLPPRSCSSSRPQYLASPSLGAPSPPPLEPVLASPFSFSLFPPPSPSPRPVAF